MTARLPGLARALVAALLFLSGPPAQAGQSPVGRYRITEGPDVASQIDIRSDGKFTYFLSAGALDEHAQGRWKTTDTGVSLSTEPRPVAPVFTADPPTRNKDGIVTLLVTWPNGRGIAGIDFRMGFETGEPVSGYTQDYGWSLAGDESRTPLWLELAEPMHGLVSPRFPIDLSKGNVLHFTLTPNDMEVFDFEGAEVEILPGELRLHRGNAVLRYVREKR